MTKQKISITVDNEILKIIENMLKDARFRNRSHVIEYCLSKFLEKNLNINKERN
jgi:Arc/MetJ-type ribon-helix-helix transcriptional regulator